MAIAKPTLLSRMTGARKHTTGGIPIGELGHGLDGIRLLYSRHMYSAGNGLAPWTPPAAFETRSFKRSGVVIGDVGFHDETSGTFLHLFNIFCDPQPSGYAFAVPDNFAPIQPPLEDWEVKTSPSHFAKGTVLSSNGIETTQELQTDLTIQFSSPVAEGSILVLPEGGSREDLIASDVLYDYVSKHALEWFRFLERYTEDRTWVMIPNGSLYLVTGLDKAPEWSNLAFRQHKAGQHDFAASYDYSKKPNPWILSNSETHTAHGNHASSEGFRHGFNGSVFIRGLRIAISPAVWTASLPNNVAPSYYSLPNSSPLRRIPHARFFKHFGIKERERKRMLVFHPSFIITQVMLSKVPESRWPSQIVVDDAIWCDVATGVHVNWPSTAELILHIFNENIIILREGIMYLAPKGTKLTAGSLEIKDESKESFLSRYLAFAGKDFRHRIDIYLVKRKVKRS